MKKILLTLAAALFSLAAFAEIHTTSVELHPFNAINVSRNFELSIVNGNSYNLELHVDSRIIDYVNFYVQAGTFYLTVEEKSFPKELSAQLKKKDENVVIKAIVTVPENHLNSITLNNTTVLESSGCFVPSNNLSLVLNDNTLVKSFRLSGKQINVFCYKKSRLKANIDCSNIIVRSYNNSVSEIEVKAVEADLSTEGNSQLNFNGKIDKCVLNSANSSKILLKGAAEKFNLSALNYSNVNATAFEVKNVSVNMSNCSATVKALENLDINLTNGARLTFDGKPIINIGRINSSSVFKLSDQKDL